MFPSTQIPLTANGNIPPRRFITSVSGNANFGLAVLATASTAIILGVSADATRNAPGSAGDDGYLAIAGEELPYHGPLQIANLDIAGTVSNMGVLLTTDGSGKGVATAPSDGTTTYYGAVALRAGVSGETIPVFVLPPTPTV